MNRTIIFILIIIIGLVACESDSQPKQDPKKKIKSNKVLNRVLENKKLRAATDYSSVTYLIYRGETIGYQYEMLKEFTNYLGVDLEMVVEKDLEKSIKMLNNGDVDLLAMGLTVTTDRSKKLEFTNPILVTHQVLIQRKPEDYRKMATADEIESHLLRNQIELADKTIYVQKGTVYAKRLASLADEIGDTITIIQEDKDVEELIQAVANKEIDYTIADEHIAKVNAKYYNNIDIKTPISFPQKIAWAAKKGQIGLTDTINSWLEDYLNSIKSRLIYNKYFRNIRSQRMAKSKYNSFSGNHLSPYDDIIKEAGKVINWDWRLLASMIYQESEFKPNVSSWVGAYGLMQLMPETMEQFGLDSTATAEEQIFAGVKYIQYLDQQLPESITDSVERIKFLLASYNSGIGHILDGRRLAEKYGKDLDTWTGSVDHFVLNLSDKFYYHDPVVYYGYTRGEETYNFVVEIMERFEDYKNLIPDE
jgi:membrane-bound lytic murein transglycosylase F